MTDLEFKKRLREYLGPHSVMPVRKNKDGSYNRKDMLAEPCFRNMPEGLRKELLGTN